MSRMKCAVLLALSIVLVAPAKAAAETFDLGWRESDGPIGVMSITVSTLTVGARGRSVRASFTNRSRVALSVVAARPPGFALRVSTSPSISTRVFRRLPATRFAPALPAVLRPGRTWRGTFGGPGRPARQTYLRVTFGRFIGKPSPLRDYPTGFGWLTDHAFRYR